MLGMVFCNTEGLCFSNEHTVLKTSQGQNFFSGDIVDFSTRIFLRQTHVVIEKFPDLVYKITLQTS